MEWLYLAGLVFSISCLTLVDWRYSLAWFYDAKRTAVTLFSIIGMFIVWDILGIRLGIFFHGGSEFALPYRIAPEFPIEELFFLYLLCYVALLVYRFLQKRAA
ncbi:MAG TPA: lycopene cyclase domain-containing protein [Candidatus Saccharimonadaceae bacterium]|nr:lycopene cyclase domain-containing protein [Candidatus Saccharimonadaceae bacterium]|tara:strand:+ start:4128 stop:4436 length:309 start_codon:yes stop_codon:yes gene_type:complete